MSEIGLICDARVPVGFDVELVVQEDVDGDGDGDGEYEVEKAQRLKDGEYLYILDGFDGDPTNSYGTTVKFLRDDSVSRSVRAEHDESPGVSYWEVIPIGPNEAGGVDPMAVIRKLEEGKYFISQMKNGDSTGFRYYLGGYLSSMYSIEEVLKKKWDGWSNRGGSDAEIGLHDFLMEVRHQGVHLMKPARGSIKPPVSQSIKWDFGESAEDSGIEQTVIFSAIPVSVMEQYVPENSRIELGNEDQSREDHSVSRIAPAGPLCEVYIHVMKGWVEDWLNTLDGEKLKSLNLGIERT